MATELKSRASMSWVPGIRLPLVLTFEHQSGEGVTLLPGDRPNYMVGGALQYGARRGIWNILELLDKYGVKATFLACGLTAESYPEAIRAASEAGHEIAGMSYNFERVRTASPERERSIVRRTSDVLESVCGAKIKGWRCPDYRVSPQTLDILSAEGFTWDSSLLNDDLPYLFDCPDGRLVEIPFTTSTADKTFIGYPYPMRGGPEGLADVWNSEFDVLYAEGENAARFMTLSIQTWATGRPAGLRTLQQFIARAAAHDGVRFVRCDELASWCTDETEVHKRARNVV
jgi:peptidoglycan/xylan/chitin deacetylase (PgdA/CDA1 family)